MSDSPPTAERKSLSPLQCVMGALTAGGFALPLYWLTNSIASTFAEKPLPSTNQTALKIAVAVRTLVVGLATLATAIFAIAAIGLLALALQTALSKEQTE
ncbi:MAG: DUF3082 domain-containing protein [Cyanobacteria bacterium P01_E01_bin.42]